MAEKKNPNQLQLDIDKETAEGIYSNLVVVSHSATEFCIDFAQLFPGAPDKAPVRSRIVMAPFHARNFLNALADNINKYEHNYGPIPGPQPRKEDNETIPYEILPGSKA